MRAGQPRRLSDGAAAAESDLGIHSAFGASLSQAGVEISVAGPPELPPGLSRSLRMNGIEDDEMVFSNPVETPATAVS